MDMVWTFQTLTLRIAWANQGAAKWLYSKFGVEYFFSVRVPIKHSSSNQDKSNGQIPLQVEDKNFEAFITRLIYLLDDDPVEIKIALGEMGKRLIDDPKIIAVLKRAKENNNAIIEVVHGPHVDPKTNKIFELGSKQIVKIYQLENYFPHHFIIIKNRRGETHIADENPHNEALWKEHNGEVYKQYRSIYRSWYILKNSVRYQRKLTKIFDDRISQAKLTNIKPNSSHDYQNHKVHILLTALNNLRNRYIIQPIDLMTDKSILVYPLVIIIVLVNIPFSLLRGVMGYTSLEKIEEKAEVRKRYIFSLIDLVSSQRIPLLRLSQVYTALYGIENNYNTELAKYMQNEYGDKSFRKTLDNIIDTFPIVSRDLQPDPKWIIKQDLAWVIEGLENSSSTNNDTDVSPSEIYAHLEKVLTEVEARIQFLDKSPNVEAFFQKA